MQINRVATRVNRSAEARKRCLEKTGDARLAPVIEVTFVLVALF